MRRIEHWTAKENDRVGKACQSIGMEDCHQQAIFNRLGKRPSFYAFMASVEAFAKGHWLASLEEEVEPYHWQDRWQQTKEYRELVKAGGLI